MKLIGCIIILLLTGLFGFCAVYLNMQRQPVARPQIVIFGTVQQLTLNNTKVWFIDYLIDGYPQGVTLYNESDIAPFIDALSMAGDVRHLKE